MHPNTPIQSWLNLSDQPTLDGEITKKNSTPDKDGDNVPQPQEIIKTEESEKTRKPNKKAARKPNKKSGGKKPNKDKRAITKPSKKRSKEEINKGETEGNNSVTKQGGKEKGEGGREVTSKVEDDEKEEATEQEATEEEATEKTYRGHYSAYSHVLNKYPLLNEDDEKKLVYQSKSPVELTASKAEEKLILSNLRLVISMAKRYTRYGCPMEDLVSEGTIGLKVAIGKYNPERGARLSTYAIWWIKQYLRKATNENTRTIRIPIYQQRTVRAIYDAVRKLTQVTGHAPTDEEIAEEIGEKTHLVQNLRNLTVPMVSLQDPVGTDQGSKTFEELISDHNGSSPLDHLKKKNTAAGLSALIQTRLSKKEQEVIRMRFGLDHSDHQCATLEEVGNTMNLTRERVRQIQEQAIVKLKRSLEAQDAQKPTLLSILGVPSPNGTGSPLNPRRYTL